MVGGLRQGSEGGRGELRTARPAAAAAAGACVCAAAKQAKGKESAPQKGEMEGNTARNTRGEGRSKMRHSVGAAHGGPLRKERDGGFQERGGDGSAS